jgi:hypothetical protein
MIIESTSKKGVKVFNNYEYVRQHQQEMRDAAAQARLARKPRRHWWSSKPVDVSDHSYLKPVNDRVNAAETTWGPDPEIEAYSEANMAAQGAEPEPLASTHDRQLGWIRDWS